MDDVAERQRWDAYMAAYEDMIRATGGPEAPWYVVPADNKSITRLVVASTIVSAMDKLDLAFPKLEGEVLKKLEEARKALINEVEAKQRTKIAAVKTSALDKRTR
jgi:hypothetical protein